MTRILCINTGGIGDLHGLRMRRLTAEMDAELTYFDLDRSMSRRENARRIRVLLESEPWDLVYQESTGIAGGLSLIRAARRKGLRYIVSTGDPVGGFFRTVRGPLWGSAFERYERALYRHCAGFIGWTPYLTGMALKMGARRAVTIEGAVDTKRFRARPAEERRAMKPRFGLDPDHIVCGVVGSLKWTPRQQYAYGLELVRMMHHVRREDVSVLIVGDGDARTRLEAEIPRGMEGRVVFAGRVPEDEVVLALNAIDVGFITQTLDGLGSYRLTTKLPEYLACGVAVAMSPVPGFFDYARDAGWPLPAMHPADETFPREVARWIDTLERSEIEERAARGPAIARARFEYEVVRPRFEQFIESVLAGRTMPSDPVSLVAEP
jgi:glycosyltransferase involved in cell wall biosynthesis